MKKLNVKIIVIGLFFVLCVNPELIVGQSRGVDWIHGMGGDYRSFEEVANFYQSGRPIQSPTRHSFESKQGVVQMANDVRSRTGGANRIAIGHSMGGVAIRQVDLWNSSQWSGVVAIGSPLRGARIANSASDGSGHAFINNATKEVMRGPKSGTSKAALHPLLGLIIESAGILGYTHSNNIASLATNEIMNGIGLVNQTREDLRVGSNYMNSVANQNTNTPKIFIWGNENNPVFWRTVGSLSSSNNDDKGISLRNKAAHQYTAISDAEYALRFINLPLYALHNHRGKEWAAGRDWFNYHGDSGWLNVIGAAYSQQQQIPIWVDRCGQEGFDWCMYDPSHSFAYCMDYCTEVRWETRTVYYHEQSDGIVTAASQRNDGGAWRDYVLEAPGVNHREMRNIENIRNSLNWVFNGNYKDGVFKIGF